MPFDAIPKRLGFAESSLTARPARSAPLGLALAAACILASTGALAQQTVIIGGGPAASPVTSGPAASTVGRGGSGIVVNDSVLDSLGPGVPAAGLPVPAPQTPVYGTGIATPVSPGSGSYFTPETSGAYRAPGTGQLVVTRPSTLLYPPMQAPKSRLAVPPARSAAVDKPAQPDRAGTAASSTGGKLTSRLIAAPPKKRPAAPAVPKVASKTPAPAKPAVTKPAKTAGTPEVPASSAKTALPTTAPAKPSVPAPPSQIAAKSPPAAATSIAPAPSVQAPSAPPAAPKVPAVSAPTVSAPKVTAPKVTAPAAPSAPTEKAAETTIAAIPQTKDRAAPSVTAATPDGDLRLAFDSGSAELSDAAKKLLKDLAQDLSLKSSERVQLLAFAADSGGGASRARRLSLSRALAVRAFLIDQGVRSTRMDVRALGSKAGDGPADRVDILPQ